jgi:hypothetical protein
MIPRAHVSTDELRDAYTRAGMWCIGMSFERAIAIRTVRWALEKSVLARRQRCAIPQQGALI